MPSNNRRHSIFQFFWKSLSSLSFKNSAKDRTCSFFAPCHLSCETVHCQHGFWHSQEKNESVSDWNSFFVRNLQRKHQAKQRCQEHCLLARKLLGSTRYNTFFQFRHWSLLISPKAKLRGPFLRPSPVFFRPLSQHAFTNLGIVVVGDRAVRKLFFKTWSSKWTWSLLPGKVAT